MVCKEKNGPIKTMISMIIGMFLGSIFSGLISDKLGALFMKTTLYIYIYIYVCVCVCINIFV